MLPFKQRQLAPRGGGRKELVSLFECRLGNIQKARNRDPQFIE